VPYFSLRNPSLSLPRYRGDWTGTFASLPASGNQTNDFYILTTAQSDPTQYIARWSGSTWVADGPFRTTGNAATTPATSSSKTLPTARLSNLGNWPIWVVRGRMWLSGYDGGRTFTLRATLPGQSVSSSSSFTMASQATGTTEPKARPTAWHTLNAKYSAASQANGATFGFTANGQYYYGRDSGTSAGSTDLVNVSGIYEYYQVPTSPTLGTTGVTTSGSTISVSWSAASDWGGDTSINSYLVQYSTSSNFSTGVLQDFVASPGTSTSRSNLANGTWYVRVFAYNSIRTNFESNPMSVPSATRSVIVNAVTTYSLTFDGNGSTGGSVPTTVTGQTTNTVYTLPGNTGSLVRTNYVFGGWSTSPTGDAVSSVTFGSSNITVYAVWQNTYTINYNANGGTGTMTATTLTNKGITGTLTVASNEFSRPGFAFSSWNTQANGSGTSYLPGSSLTLTAPSTAITLFAQWTASTPVFSDSTITTTWYIGRNYSGAPDRQVTASPVTSYSIIYSGSGTNPTSWLTINSSGQLSGLPPQIGSYTFLIRATSGTSTQDTGTYTLSILPSGRRYTSTSANTPLAVARRFVGIGQPGADPNGWRNLSIMRRFDGIWKDIANN
jgi:hypothetical protein